MGLSFEKLDRGGGCTRDARRKESASSPSLSLARLSFFCLHSPAGARLRPTSARRAGRGPERLLLWVFWGGASA